MNYCRFIGQTVHPYCAYRGPSHIYLKDYRFRNYMLLFFHTLPGTICEGVELHCMRNEKVVKSQ